MIRDNELRQEQELCKIFNKINKEESKSFSFNYRDFDFTINTENKYKKTYLVYAE